MAADSVIVVIALAVAVVALVAGVASPYLVSWQNNKHRRQERLEDYARQDAVADRLTRNQAAAARQADAALGQAAKSAKETNGKLDQIHTLVNSNLTSVLQAELDATVSLLVLMRRLHALEPSDQAQAAIDSTQRKVDKLKANLTDRMEQTRTADEQAAEAAEPEQDA